MAVDRPTCTPPPPPPTTIQIRFPFGITLESMALSNTLVATQLNHVQSLLAAAVPALATFQPIFVLVDTVIALKDVAVSIPGLIVGDVDTFLSALERVVNGVSKLTGVVPQVAVPVLVLDLVSFLVVVLNVLIDQLDIILALEAKAAAALEAAQTAPEAYRADLLNTVQCSEEEAAALLEHAVAAMNPVQNILAIIGILTQLVQGLPGMPDVGDLTGSAEDVRATLEELRDALQDLLNVIPGG